MTEYWVVDLRGALDPERALALGSIAHPGLRLGESAKTLVAQFVHQTFVNSGGARYSPPFAAEAVFVEDFPEDTEPASDALAGALGIGRRRGLVRD